MNCESLRTHCRCLLAAAVSDLFPEARLLGGCATAHGFYYDFELPVPFQEHMLVQIEERMRRTKADFRLSEMVPSNAASFLEHKGFSERARMAKASPEPLLQVAELGDFADFYEGECGASPGQFKLLEALPYGRKTRLCGAAFASKDDLKAFLKAQRPVLGRRFEDLCPQLGLMQEVEGRTVWMPKGEAVRVLLVDFWRKEVEKGGIQILSTHSLSLDEMERVHRKTGLLRTAELTSIGGEFVDQTYCRGSDLEQERISSLLFIEKILKMLSFDFKRVSRSKDLVEFQIKDVFGGWVRGPYVRADRPRKTVIRSVFAPLERLFELLIENGEGCLPLRVAPEQVRVVRIGGADASQVAQELIKNGFRVRCEAAESQDLKKQMYDALRERIPYSIVLGSREKETGLLSVRKYGADEPEMMTIETLTGRLKELENQ